MREHLSEGLGRGIGDAIDPNKTGDSSEPLVKRYIYGGGEGNQSITVFYHCGQDAVGGALSEMPGGCFGGMYHICIRVMARQ